MPTQTETNVQGAKWSTAYVDSLPNSSFAYVSGNVRKLPYKNADGKVDLPHVRDALSRLSNTQGPSDSEKAAIKTKLTNALKASDVADDMVLRTTSAIQADTTSSTLPDRVHLLRDGNFNTQKYGEIPIEAADLYEMKFNFERGLGMAGDGQTGIPIDFAHQSHLEAAGWVHGLEVVQAEDGGTELWGTKVEWSDSGKQALEGKKYKCLSSDFYPAAFGEWVDPESGVTAKNVIVGAALTNRPMFTGNQPVIASEAKAASEEEAEATGVKTVIYVNASETKKETSMKLDELRVKAADDLTGPEALFIAQNVDKLDDAERNKFGLKASVKEEPKEEPKAVKASEVTGTEGTVSVEASELKSIVDDNKNLKASVEKLEGHVAASQKKDAESYVDGLISEGKIVASQKDDVVKRVLADETTRELFDALPGNKLLGKKQGGNATEAADKTAKEQLMDKAKEIMAAAPADAPIDIQTAMKKAAEQNQELATRAADENRELAGVKGAVA